MQVWNKLGQLLYQKVFQQKVTKWTLSNDILLWKTPEDDDNCTVVEIVKLSKTDEAKGVTLTIKNMKDNVFEIMGWTKGRLMITNSSNKTSEEHCIMYYIDLSEELENLAQGQFKGDLEVDLLN